MAGTVRRQAPRTRMVVEGNTVRREEPGRQRKENQRQKRRTLGRAALRQNRERAQQLNVPSMLVLAAASVACVCLCVGSLGIQSQITSGRKSIGQLESELQTMRTDNRALEDRIQTLADLDYVYQVATEELGMIYPSDGQVIYYEKSESEYVRQYEDIPTD